jgi:hypothetical protein
MPLLVEQKIFGMMLSNQLGITNDEKHSDGEYVPLPDCDCAAPTCHITHASVCSTLSGQQCADAERAVQCLGIALAEVELYSAANVPNSVRRVTSMVYRWEQTRVGNCVMVTAGGRSIFGDVVFWGLHSGTAVLVLRTMPRIANGHGFVTTCDLESGGCCTVALPCDSTVQIDHLSYTVPRVGQRDCVLSDSLPLSMIPSSWLRSVAEQHTTDAHNASSA